MRYFLDASNVLWWFNGFDLTKVCEIDKIVYQKSSGTLMVMINDEAYFIKKNCIHSECGQRDLYRGNYKYVLDFNFLTICADDSYFIELERLGIKLLKIDTNIDSTKYAVIRATRDLQPVNSSSCGMDYIEKSGLISQDDHTIPLMCYSVDIYTEKSKTTLSVLYIRGSWYEHIQGGYLRTDLGIFDINKSEYIECDHIFPNLTNSIMLKNNKFYIGDLVLGDEVEEFDFGRRQLKSARNI